MATKKKVTKQLNEPNELTKEELRKFKGLENLNDAEAECITAALQVLSLITYQLFETQNNLCNGKP
jgi:hypothetical protein